MQQGYYNEINMNTKKILLLVIIFNTVMSFSQSISGKVVYRAVLNTDDYVENVKNDRSLDENSKKTKIKNSLSSEAMNFFLFFKGKESIYRAEYDLNDQRDMLLGWNQTGMAAGDDYISYVNLDTKENVRQNFFLDKLLISVTPLEWTLCSETKQIGKYVCYKATAVLKEEHEKGGVHSDAIVAWYTPKIPVTFGIQNFTGLPGLTLELSVETDYGKLQYNATSIKLNVKNVKIKKPKGKVITHKKFIELTRNFRG